MKNIYLKNIYLKDVYIFDTFKIKTLDPASALGSHDINWNASEMQLNTENISFIQVG